jgi:exodeoxyribonuclease VII small subunit
MKTPHTYQEAFDELQTLLAQIESGDVSIDTLSAHVKRSMVLIEICKQKLYATEKDVQELLEQLNNKERMGADFITDNTENVPKEPEELSTSEINITKSDESAMEDFKDESPF